MFSTNSEFGANDDTSSSSDDNHTVHNQTENADDTDYENAEDSLEEEESWEGLKCYSVNELKTKLAERGLIRTGNKSDLIERLLNPQPSDYVRARAPQTFTSQNAEKPDNEESHAENSDNEESQGSGDKSLIGFDDGVDAEDPLPLEEIEESQEDLECYSV